MQHVQDHPMLKPILKLNIGLVQCWVLFELALKINVNIRLTTSLSKSVNPLSANGGGKSEGSSSDVVGRGSQRIYKLIEYGQCVFLSIITLELSSLIVFFIIKSVELGDHDREVLCNTWM